MAKALTEHNRKEEHWPTREEEESTSGDRSVITVKASNVVDWRCRQQDPEEESKMITEEELDKKTLQDRIAELERENSAVKQENIAVKQENIEMMQVIEELRRTTTQSTGVTNVPTNTAAPSASSRISPPRNNPNNQAAANEMLHPAAQLRTTTSTSGMNRGHVVGDIVVRKIPSPTSTFTMSPLRPTTADNATQQEVNSTSATVDGDESKEDIGTINEGKDNTEEPAEASVAYMRCNYDSSSLTEDHMPDKSITATDGSGKRNGSLSGPHSI